LDSVDQGANDIPVSTISLKDSKLSLTVNDVQGTYEGNVNKKATEITGTWLQGQPLELNFKRAPAQSAATAAAAAQPLKPSLDGLDGFVAQAMKDWKVPGLAIAVIQGDKVILKKGYGYRDLESSCR
jgi:Beta-lactamase